jgi:hypothetical protein
MIMKRDHRTLSDVREASPFAAPPRVLVIAEDSDPGQAAALVETLESLGADAQMRFVSDVTRTYREHLHPDAVIVAGTRGYHFMQDRAGLAPALRAAQR